MVRDGARPSVLVVDDTPGNLVAMRAVLEPLDIDVVEASSGENALELAARYSFALALIDVQMPIMDGFELAARLRQTPDGCELPIIFVSAVHRDERYISQGYAAGAADYLTKPLEVDVVRARVRAFIDLFRQRERLRAREHDAALDEIARLLERERAARHDAEVANAAKDEFVAVISHELRTPLTAILGWAVLARKMAPGAELEQALETIERNARVQMQLVDDLLDIGRAKTGKLRLHIEDISVADAIMSAVATFAPTAERTGVDLVCGVVDAGTIRADGNRIRQVITNLLSNAIKFTPNGGRVSIVAKRVEAAVEIQVTDTGEGLAPEFLPHVFEPFRQADPSKAERHGGLGLGLAIAKRLVDEHGGSLRAESAGLGRGTTFTVRLPLVAALIEAA